MIPLTVIGGFLGAGKTTLLNHLLRAGAKRWGVLVNDFGAIGVDAALIAEREGETIALSNGCVCCAMGEDLGDALARLAARGPDHVIVEASGIADPWRIAQLALVEPGFALEPLVVLADATALAATLADRWTEDTASRQLAFADIVLLNKTDIATSAQRAAARAAIAAIRPQARLIETIAGAVAPETLSFPTPAMPRIRFHADTPHPFVTTTWTQTEPLDRTRLRALLCDLPPAILRIKGVVTCADGPALLQYAAERWAFTPPPPGLPAGLVIIGTPEMPDLAARLAACAA